jgi:hypothetical protein
MYVCTCQTFIFKLTIFLENISNTGDLDVDGKTAINFIYCTLQAQVLSFHTSSTRTNQIQHQFALMWPPTLAWESATRQALVYDFSFNTS